MTDECARTFEIKIMSEQRYLVAARKYRPQLFGEIVAQEHVTETLKNAIRLERLAHAYLFSGPRGVGQTTAARILAKAINCTTPPDQRTDAAEPCRECESCRSFEEGRNLNIIEIDAASNNKVDDIRELRDTVRIPPQGNRKKVYIIDEVHMLSTAAFNALLKTLEEPPPYVLFIFATTEPHKVLPTILSRCQRFDFRRIAGREIVNRLKSICEAEGVTADEGSLMLIARKGDGALRDALSALDQAVSLCGNELRADDLTRALGVVDVDLFFEATGNVLQADSAGMLRLVEKIMRAGYDLQEFLFGISEHVRNLLVARTMPDTSLIEATELVQKRYAEQSKQFSEADLLRLLMIVDEAQDSIRNSTMPRLRLEMALLKMASLTRSADLQQALKRIDTLEELARKGALPTGTVTEPPYAFKPRVVPEPAPEPSPTDPGPKKSPEKSEDDEQRPVFSSRPEKKGIEETSYKPSPEPRPVTPRTGVSAASPTPPDPAYTGIFSPPALSGRPRQVGNTSSRTGGDVSNLAETVVAEPPAEVDAQALFDAVVRIWPRVVEIIKNEKIGVSAPLLLARPVAARHNVVSIALPDDFNRSQLEQARPRIARCLNELLEGRSVELEFIVSTATEQGETKEEDEEIDPYEIIQRKREEDPVIRAIFDQFGGEIVY